MRLDRFDQFDVEFPFIFRVVHCMTSGDPAGPAPHPRAQSVTHPWIRAILDADLSTATKDQYTRNLSVLQKLSDRRPLEDIVKYPRAAYARIEAAYTNDQTKKAFVSSIKGLFKHVPGLKETYPEALEEWNTRFKMLDKLIFDQIASAEPSDRERVNWVPWKDIVMKERELAYSRYGSSEHLMLAMYTLIEPLRADFGVLKVVEKQPPSTDQGVANFIVMQPNGTGQLVLNAYKTSKKYGRFEREIPDALLNVIRASLSTQPRAYLFVDEQGKPYVIKNSYIRYANRIFAKIFGKNLTIRLLRHAFISNLDFNGSTPATLIEHSKMMLHSIGMQQMYRRHIDPAVPSTQPTYPPGHAPLPPLPPLPPPPGPPPHSTTYYPHPHQQYMQPPPHTYTTQQYTQQPQNYSQHMNHHHHHSSQRPRNERRNDRNEPRHDRHDRNDRHNNNRHRSSRNRGDRGAVYPPAPHPQSHAKDPKDGGGGGGGGGGGRYVYV